MSARRKYIEFAYKEVLEILTYAIGDIPPIDLIGTCLEMSDIWVTGGELKFMYKHAEKFYNLPHVRRYREQREEKYKLGNLLKGELEKGAIMNWKQLSDSQSKLKEYAECYIGFILSKFRLFGIAHYEVMIQHKNGENDMASLQYDPYDHKGVFRIDVDRHPDMKEFQSSLLHECVHYNQFDFSQLEHTLISVLDDTTIKLLKSCMQKACEQQCIRITRDLVENTNILDEIHKKTVKELKIKWSKI